MRAAILVESQSRAILIELAELALHRAGADVFTLTMPTQKQSVPVPLRSTGASTALAANNTAIAGLVACTFVADCTLEGLLPAPELPQVMAGGARWSSCTGSAASRNTGRTIWAIVADASWRGGPRSAASHMEGMAIRLPKATFAAPPAARHLMNLGAPVAFRAALTSSLSSLE